MKPAPPRVLPLLSLLVLLGVALAWYLASPKQEPTALQVLAPEAASLQASKPPADAIRLLPSPRWDGSVSLAALPLTEGARSRALGAAWMPSSGIQNLEDLEPGDVVAFPLETTAELAARVERVATDDGRLTVSGRLAQGAAGSFVISHAADKQVEGHVLNQDRHIAYQFKQDGDRVVMAKLPLGEIVCEGIPLEPNHIAPIPGATQPKAARAIPALDSKPNAAGVLYLDFDGEIVTDPLWNGGVTIVAQPATFAGSPITNAQIEDVWERVAEDFMPFNVSVTTIRSRYDNAPVGNRMRCIQTPTKDAAPTAGGVAYLKSYRASFASGNFRNDIPCWSFNSNNAAVMAMTISHELGHTFNLRHDGDPDNEYYSGHGTGNLRWGPIMGAPFSARVVQWSKGQYPGANNLEDDVLITKNVIEEANGTGNGFRPDETGSTIATAEDLGVLATISKFGVIHTETDRDYYEFRTAGGPINVTAALANEANLDPRLRLLNSSNTVIESSTVPATSLGASISATLTAGTYYLVVEGGGRAATPNYAGYTTYGSIGGYTLTGSYVPLPEIPLITLDPEPMTVAREGTSITLRGAALSNTKVNYRWRKDGNILPGKTSPTLTINPVNHTHGGTYLFEAVNGAGPATSQPAVVVIEYKPVFTLQPPTATQTLPTGGSATLNVAAHGTGVLTYQWKKDGVDITGNATATTTSLELTGLDWFDSGNYTCVSTNSFGSTTSAVAKLSVTSAPLFTASPPTTVAVAKNSSFTLRTSLVGSPTIRFQWFKGATAIPGATKSSLTLTKASELVHEGDAYFLRATNTQGTNDSDPVSVDVQDPPAVTITGPTAINSVAGASAALSVAGTGTATLNYQWYLNNQLLLGETSPTLNFASLFWTHRGTYKCVVTNAVGKATSKNMTVAMTSPAVIITPPASTKIPTKGKRTLNVVAGGTPALRYQWLKDGNPIPGATKSSLTLSNASQLTEGSYQVQVYNALNMMPETSNPPAMVEVENPPVIAQHPVTTYAPLGGSVTFTSAATLDSAPVLRYQWFKGKLLLAGETNPTLTLNGLTAASAGSYHVVITNDVGTATSRKATLFVQAAPDIITQPTDLRHFERDTAIFSVKATGAATLKYTWHYNNGPAIPGATGPTLTLKNLTTAAAGTYHCVVSNKVGSEQSTTVNLLVDVIPAATITSFTPGVAAIGHRVRVNGTNLNWTTHIRLGPTTCSFVKVSPEEVVFTVPPGGRTGQIILTTHAGVVTAPGTLTITSTASNDNFANATILLGTKTTATGSNVGATTEAGEIVALGDGKTVWYRWRCPASGSYTLKTNITTFGHFIQVFSATSVSVAIERAVVYRYENTFGAIFQTGPSSWDAFVNEEYYFRLDGKATTQLTPNEGNISFTISPSTSIPLAYSGPASEEEGASFTPASSSASSTLTTGPTEFDVPVLNQISGTGTFKTAFDAGSDSPAFEWRVSGTGGVTLLKLEFDPVSRTITGRDHAGNALETDQVYSGVGVYDMELALDATAGTWNVLLNGQAILPTQTWQTGTSASGPTPEFIALQYLNGRLGKLPSILSAEWLSTGAAPAQPEPDVEE